MISNMTHFGWFLINLGGLVVSHPKHVVWWYMGGWVYGLPALNTHKTPLGPNTTRGWVTMVKFRTRARRPPGNNKSSVRGQDDPPGITKVRNGLTKAPCHGNDLHNGTSLPCHPVGRSMCPLKPAGASGCMAWRLTWYGVGPVDTM